MLCLKVFVLENEVLFSAGRREKGRRNNKYERWARGNDVDGCDCYP